MRRLGHSLDLQVWSVSCLLAPLATLITVGADGRHAIPSASLGRQMLRGAQVLGTFGDSGVTSL